jgi:hypothetical protein
VIEIGNGLAHGAFVKHGLPSDHAGHQCGGVGLVDAARQALGVLEDAAAGVIGKQSARGVTGHADVVANVGNGFSHYVEFRNNG